MRGRAYEADLFFWLAQNIHNRLPQYRRLKPLEVVRRG